MRNFTLRTLLLCLLSAFGYLSAQGQTIMYGCSPFQDSMWAVDTSAGFSVVGRYGPTLAGFTITGINGMAYDPCQHETYVIMKVSGVSGRVLGKMDLATGACTQVGNLGDNFSSIAFDETGQLYGLTGDGATVSETVYLVDKTNGNKTLLTALGNGADGEVMCYNPFNKLMFHWSGNGTVIYEKFQKTAPFTVTGISGSLGGGETFGALNLGPNRFLISTINSNFRYVDTLGVASNTFGSMPDDMRGLVMPPAFTFSDDTICANQSASFSFSGYTTDTVLYVWGDGVIDTVFPAAGASHVYTTTANRVPRVVLRNACNPSDTVFTTALRVNNIPVVNLTPGQDTIMCFADTLNVTGTSGGTSQWYQDGLPISGANTNQYAVTVSGHYNLLKTNLNGCSDSSATGITVLFGDQPTADLTGDTTVCGTDSLCFTLVNPANVSYLWSNGATTASTCATNSGLFSVMAMDSVGCVATDSLTIAFRDVPTISFTVDTSLCPTISFVSLSSDVDTYSWTFGDGGTSSVAGPTHTYTSNGTYTISVAVGNPCGTANASQSVTINCVVGTMDAHFSAASIYPNPNTGTFTLQAQLGTAGDLAYRLVDLSGRELYSVQRAELKSLWQEQISLNNLPSGMYFLHMVSNGAKASLIVVVE
jgi:PKD repeat protein